MKTLLLLLVVVLLAGCQTVGPSAEQIKEMRGTSSSMCVEMGPGFYTPAASVHYTSFGGQSVGTAGGGGVATCGKSSITFTNEGRLPPPGTTTTTVVPATTTTIVVPAKPAP